MTQEMEIICKWNGNFCSDPFRKKWSTCKVCLFFAEISVLTPHPFEFQPVVPRILVKWKMIQCFKTTGSITILFLDGIRDTIVSQIRVRFEFLQISSVK